MCVLFSGEIFSENGYTGVTGDDDDDDYYSIWKNVQ